MAEEQAGKIDEQILSLEQEILQMRQTMNELEVTYRRCLLESQKARDAVESLLEQLHEEMGISDPRELLRYTIAHTEMGLDGADGGEEDTGEDGNISPVEVDVLSEEEESQLRKLRRRVDNLRSRLKALGGCDPDAPQQYEETRTRFEFLSTQITDMEQAAQHLHSIISQLDDT